MWSRSEISETYWSRRAREAVSARTRPSVRQLGQPRCKRCSGVQPGGIGSFVDNDLRDLALALIAIHHDGRPTPHLDLGCWNGRIGSNDNVAVQAADEIHESVGQRRERVARRRCGEHPVVGRSVAISAERWCCCAKFSRPGFRKPVGKSASDGTKASLYKRLRRMADACQVLAQSLRNCCHLSGVGWLQKCLRYSDQNPGAA